jgi:hypothetical protein
VHLDLLAHVAAFPLLDLVEVLLLYPAVLIVNQIILLLKFIFFMDTLLNFIHLHLEGLVLPLLECIPRWIDIFHCQHQFGETVPFHLFFHYLSLAHVLSLQRFADIA